MTLSINFTSGSPTISKSGDLSTFTSMNDFYITRESKIRYEIDLLTRKEHNVIGTYKQLLRAVLSYFSDMVCIDSENKITNIKCIYANPEKVIGLLNKDNSMILPVISVSQTESSTDLERSRYKSILVHETMFDTEKRRAVRVLSVAPVPVSIRYSVNVWTKYKEDQDQLTEQIRLKFNPDADLTIPKHNLIKAYLSENENLLGSFEANDKEDRVLKKSFFVDISTYINNPKFLFTNTGTIERINIE